MQAIIHLNDNNLIVQMGEQYTRHQGYAWMQQGEVYFDLDVSRNAVLNCRLQPQQINNRYWQQCEQSALPANDSGMRHSADLIWKHLTALARHHGFSELIFVVPSHYQSANLELLIGIAQACNLSAAGIINKAVLERVLNSQQHEGRSTHIDIQLHQTVCSEITLEDGLVELGQVEIVHDVGLSQIQDSLLKEIQQIFINSDRFDPLHYADTEQQLFDTLPNLITQLSSESKANVSVSHASQLHAVSIDQSQWQRCIQHHLDKLALVPLVREANLSRYDLNGFEAFKDIEYVQPVSLSWRQLLDLCDQDSESGLVYRTNLSVNNAQTTSAISTDTEKSQTERFEGSSLADKSQSAEVTHLLQDGVAVPLANSHVQLSERGLVLSYGEENIEKLISQRKLFIFNDATRKEFKVNDRLASELADGVITMIRVET